MDSKYGYYGYFFVKIFDKEKFLDSVKSLEEEGLFLQAFPCKYLLDIELVEIAAKLALRDFEQKVNRAKKISTEFLLRLTGISQIRDVFKNFFDLDKYEAILVVFYQDDEKIRRIFSSRENVFKYISDKLNGCKLIEDLDCRGSIDKIFEKYGVSERELSAIDRPNLDYFEKIKRIIIERMALSIYK